jgi:hypothetical protein
MNLEQHLRIREERNRDRFQQWARILAGIDKNIIIVHSCVYAKLQKEDLVTWSNEVRDGALQTIRRFKEKEIFLDDDCPNLTNEEFELLKNS